MKKSTYILLFLLFACLAPASAQKKKTVKKKAAKVETPVENPRFTEMLSSTQRIVIIDSMVVSKNTLLSAFLTNPEEGRIATYNQFFNTQDQPNGFVYVNELGNKCIFSMSDNGVHRLYSCDLLGNEWSTPELLQGLDTEGLTDMNYPYMMPDGQTLYFAARNGDALGGYDIYRTRFDNEAHQFLTPENLGLPFNSESDDFLYVVCEQDSIGFFATTRHQSEGQVCVYTFISSERRQIYDIDATDGQTLRSYARIDHIRDTWGNNHARTAALRRLEALRTINNSQQPQADKGAFAFVINDHITYHRIQDFKDPDNASRINELQSMQRELAEIETTLKRLRENYAKASTAQRNQMRNQVLLTEQKQLQLSQQIHSLEKEIRNRELTN